MTQKIDVEALRAKLNAALALMDKTTGEIARPLEGLPANAWSDAVFAILDAAPALLAAYKAHDAAVRERDARTEERDAVEAPMTEICKLLGLDDCDDAPGAVRRILAERDEAKRELRKCTINKDELWKVVRADADKLRQAKEDGEDVTQMLVQRDREADEQIAALTAERDALKVERDRYKHIAERTQRSRRYSSEQWAHAAREAFDGKPQNLRNRVELQELPAPRHENQFDGSALMIFDGEKLETIDAALASQDATIATLREALETAGEAMDLAREKLGIAGEGDGADRRADAKDTCGLIDAIYAARAALEADAPALAEVTDAMVEAAARQISPSGWAPENESSAVCEVLRGISKERARAALTAALDARLSELEKGEGR